MNLFNIGGDLTDKGKVHIINEDCIKAMRHIPSKSIDLIICDLPYG